MPAASKTSLVTWFVCLMLVVVAGSLSGKEQQGRSKPDKTAVEARRAAKKDARNRSTSEPAAPQDPELQKYGIYAKTAPVAEPADAIATSLPLKLNKGDRIALIVNTLLDRAQHFGHLEALLHSHFPKHELVVRNLSWSADTIDLQPRPANFANLDQHLAHEKIDVIIAAFGFNE